MVDSVDRLKELLFKQESATLADLERQIAAVADTEREARGQIAGLDARIARLATAEAEARDRIAESLRQLEAIRRLGEESRELHDRLEKRFAELNSRTGTPSALRSSVAAVIDEVIVEARQDRQEDLSRALAPMLVRTIKAELRNNQAEMVEALYPITGQLVKSYVASAMRDLTNRMNRSVQSNGVMLRIRSLFSGYSAAELRLAETQRLEVEELYLIRRGSGELIRRFPESLARSNSDAHMSGVLAAINDFAATAFEGEGGQLRAFDLGDFTLFLRASPVYLLAAKCRGAAAPGVDGLIDSTFLDAVGRFHAVDTPDADTAASIRVLSDVKSRLEAGIAERHDELSSAGMPFNPVRAFAVMAVLALLAGGGWLAWTSWEVEQTRTAARRAIEETAAMSGYPVTLEVGARGRSLAVAGLAPSASARSQVMAGLAAALPGVVIEDRGLAALPAQGRDLTPDIASVRKDLGSVESALRREVETVERQTAEAAHAAAVRTLERAQQRLRDALPDLVSLAARHSPPRRGEAESSRRAVEAVHATITAEVERMRSAGPGAGSDRRSIDASLAAAAQLRRNAETLAGIIGDTPGTARPASTATPAPVAGNLTVAAEHLALAAERLATVAAAALQASSIRIPEPPKIMPTPLELLQAYVSRNAVFFGNNEDYLDTARAEAIIGEVVHLAREAKVLVRVVGYTDERGAQTRNNPLAQSRADKVAQALVARGLPKQFVVAVGRATGPDLSPETGPGSANRRAEFEIGFHGEPGGAR